MKDNEKKLKLECSPEDLGNFFRQMADAVYGRGDGDGNDLGAVFADYKKIGIKIRRKTDAVSVKLKVEQDGSLPEDTDGAETSDEPGKIKYKALKKRMKSSFKQIRDSISTGSLPGADAVQSFLQDSELMIGFPGKGDEYYEPYRHACQEFARAFEGNEFEAVQKSCDILAQLRKDCHKRHK